ncbi:MAG: stage II sporulation protein R [Xylanivirga thermophila]|jgi:stage II sporulation protein R|uniref:stage II sporulation protein R n=1 Tax=Xylanivirga thermophila TaxID=2496273 RepID=UPI00101B7853|nr:stage II sporulation protein R [Xylanivirga thermophila]
MRKKYYILTLVCIMIVLCFIYNIKNIHKTNNNEYIRFHVIANSDSPEDQRLKLRVRDRLLEEFGQRFKDLDSKDQAAREIEKHLQDMEHLALEEIEKSGMDYGATAQLGYFDFPTKAYGSLVLPAGRYHALRVVLGEGEGANWWCVMFPPLCFVDITHGVVREGQTIKDNDIGEEDDNNVFQDKSTDNQSIKVEYRFKTQEWISNSMPKMAKMFSFIHTWLDE